jgi:galactose mutarotase-like enzyme
LESMKGADYMLIRENVQGFPVVGLANKEIEIRTIPDLGAKICNLKNCRTGREWMWTPPGGPRYFRNKTGDSFPNGTLVGADECIPTLCQCQWRGLKLPDHGEVWTEAWTLDEQALAKQQITVGIDMPLSPLKFERTIKLAGNRVEFKYTLTNKSDEPFEYVWALHPMMAIEDGDQLVLPQECKIMRLDATVINCGLGNRGTVIKWPNPQKGIHLNELVFDSDNAAVKFFTEPLTLGCASIRNKLTGEYIVYSCDTSELNTFGVWINRGGWAGYHHVAIEPSNGAPDPLDLAVKDWKRYSSLNPGQSCNWKLSIYVGIDKKSEGDEFLKKFSY